MGQANAPKEVFTHGLWATGQRSPSRARGSGVVAQSAAKRRFYLGVSRIERSWRFSVTSRAKNWREGTLTSGRCAHRRRDHGRDGAHAYRHGTLRERNTGETQKVREKRRTPGGGGPGGAIETRESRRRRRSPARCFCLDGGSAEATDKETEERHRFELKVRRGAWNTLTMPFVDWNIPAFEPARFRRRRGRSASSVRRTPRTFDRSPQLQVTSGAEVRAIMTR